MATLTLQPCTDLDVGALLVDVASHAQAIPFKPLQSSGLIVGQASPENLLLVLGYDVHGHEHVQGVIHAPPDVLLVILLWGACKGVPGTNLVPAMLNSLADSCHATPVSAGIIHFHTLKPGCLQHSTVISIAHQCDDAVLEAVRL